MADAADLVLTTFPTARWAVLGGSVVTPVRTAGSDLDIVVMLPDDDPDPPYVRSLRWRGWPVELFVYTTESLEYYLAEDVRNRRPAMVRIVAGAVTLLGSAEEAAAWRQRCAATLAAGPGPLGQRELGWARYSLTDLLDDIAHSRDAGETAALTAELWLATARLACDAAGHWRGGGKWIVRELRDQDPVFAERWGAAAGDRAAVVSLAEEVLDSAGGPLFDGYVRPDPRRPR